MIGWLLLVLFGPPHDPTYTPPPEWCRYTRKRDGKRMVAR